MKSYFLAAAFAASLAFALPTEADAKVTIYFGVPYYDYQVGPDYRHREGYGWYRYSRFGDFYGRARLSCGEAKWRVRERGYRNVDTIECRGRTYTFEASRRGNRVIVYVDSRSGEVWRG